VRGCPVAYPAAELDPPEVAPFHADAVDLGEPTIPPSAGSVPPELAGANATDSPAAIAQRVSALRLVEVERALSNRDRAILRLLSRHRYATTGQLRRILFTGHSSDDAATRATIRVLDRLLERRLVARLDRSVGGRTRGSAAYIWYLDAAGERLTRPRGAHRRRYIDPSLPFLDHALQITETIASLHEAGRAGGPALTRIEVETEAWRTYLTGTGITTVLKPDLFLTIAGTDADGDYDDHWYVEIDRGTESLPVLLAKCRAYAAYRRTGAAQAEHGVFPRVLWVVPTQRRVGRLRAALAAAPELPDRLFTVITPEQLVPTIHDPPDP